MTHDDGQHLDPSEDELNTGFAAVMDSITELSPQQGADLERQAERAELGHAAYAVGLDYLERGEREWAVRLLQTAAFYGVDGAQQALRRVAESTASLHLAAIASKERGKESAELTANFPFFTVAAAARMSGLHPQTLRQYERLGVVTPDRTHGRRYSVHDIERLRQAQQLYPAVHHDLAAFKRTIAAADRSLLSRVGSAEWNLLTDEVAWSKELYLILGRSPQSAPMSLDELRSLILADDQARFAAAVTDCLVDGLLFNTEFRIILDDRRVRTIHMMGEPVLDPDGSTASMWAVMRDVTELRRSQPVLRETCGMKPQQTSPHTEIQPVDETQEIVLPPWQRSLHVSLDDTAGLEVSARHLPPVNNPTLIASDWYDALRLSCGGLVLSVGSFAWGEAPESSSAALLLGALRGMAVAGISPGPLLTFLNQLLKASLRPVLCSMVSCRYEPSSRRLSWAVAGHPAPLLFRDGRGWSLTPPDGGRLGAMHGSEYEQAEVQLLPGDLMLLHTGSLTGRNAAEQRDTKRLLTLAPRFAAARDTQECVRMVAEEFADADREVGASLMVVRVAS
ncbi:PP2C family protein-serine/threonine phosphatase [Streptomyces canus]|uniref:PP2C family protein-serine/threonine phosphatase n=1 Tax=Streptomyces canus TaxID=58343 RepID=UPI003810EB47